MSIRDTKQQLKHGIILTIKTHIKTGTIHILCIIFFFLYTISTQKTNPY